MIKVGAELEMEKAEMVVQVEDLPRKQREEVEQREAMVLRGQMALAIA